MFYKDIQEMIEEANRKKCRLSDLVIEYYINKGITREDLYEQMGKNWDVMESAIKRGLDEDIKSISGLTGGDAKKLNEANKNKNLILQGPTMQAVAKALAVAEVNAAMGRVVAAPTAGSCGILPAVISTVVELKKSKREDIIAALFTAGGIGIIIADKASISGAEGGCQAECGSASGMAAAAAVELAGGSPEEAGHAAAIALKGILGLVCDPVAGLVEVPCIKRNATGTANALMAADMALAGIESKIPVDEVIAAMDEVGKLMPVSLKETSCAGLANTKTARFMEESLLENIQKHK